MYYSNQQRYTPEILSVRMSRPYKSTRDKTLSERIYTQRKPNK